MYTLVLGKFTRNSDMSTGGAAAGIFSPTLMSDDSGTNVSLPLAYASDDFTLSTTTFGFVRYEISRL
eukprot:6002639-Pyramimonas_sp.AAC.1